MKPMNRCTWILAWLLASALLAAPGEAAAAGKKKSKNQASQNGEQMTAVQSETQEADAGEENGKKKGGKKRKKKDGKKDAAEKEPATAGAEPPRVVREVEKRLLAYDTAGARSLLASEPVVSNPHLLVADGRVLEQEKRYGEAAARFQEAARQASDDPAPLVHLGQSQIHAGNMAAADDAFRQAESRARARLAANPGDEEALYYLGVAQQRLKRYDEAVATFGKLGTSDAETLFQLGVTRAFQGNWQAALDRLTEAIDRNPGIAYAYYYRGLAANQLGRKDLLVNDLDRFVTMAPEAPEAAQARRLLQGL